MGNGHVNARLAMEESSESLCRGWLGPLPVYPPQIGQVLVGTGKINKAWHISKEDDSKAPENGKMENRNGVLTP